MSLRLVRAVSSVTLLGLGVAACDNLGTSGPRIELLDVRVDFCSNDVPIWFAFRNENAPWENVQPDAEGTFSFTASNHVGIAYVWQDGADAHTEVLFTSNRDLEGMSDVVCLEESGTKQVNGSVAGVTGAELGLVSMNFGSAILTSSQSTFSLTNLPDRPLDLVASRVLVTGTEQQATRTILRRTLNLLHQATMPVLDFGGSEAVVPVTQSATLEGIVAEDTAFILNNLFTQLETSHALTFLDKLTTNGPKPIVALPAAVLAQGDYHDLIAVTVRASTGSSRGTERFFHNPANQTLSIGPELNIPTITTIATIPYVQLRAQLQAQTDYTTMLNVLFSQQNQFAVKSVSFFVTASYFGGTPVTWDLVIPNFSGAVGWNDSWGLDAGAYDWQATAYFGRPDLILGARPNDGDVVDFATQMSSGSAIQMSSGSATRSRRGGALFPPRPRIFGRGRTP